MYHFYYFLSSLSFLISVGSDPEDALQSFQFPIDKIDSIDLLIDQLCLCCPYIQHIIIKFSILSVTPVTDV